MARQRSGMSLERWISVSRWQGWAAGLVIVGLLVWSAARLGQRWVERAMAADRLRGKVHVMADPAWIELSTEQGSRMLQLAGVRVPESWQAQVRAMVAEQIEGRDVWAVLVGAVEGEAGAGARARARARACVYREDGFFLNEWLLNEGWAEFDGRRDHRLADWMSRLEHFAKKAARGGWE